MEPAHNTVGTMHRSQAPFGIADPHLLPEGTHLPKIPSPKALLSAAYVC